MPLSASDFNKVHEKLGLVQDFNKPSILLEQYMTDRDTCVEILKLVDRLVGLEGKTVIDLGSGTGMLGIGALYCDSAEVTFVECDQAALNECDFNLVNMDWDPKENYSLHYRDACTFTPEKEVDIVITNPPFGTRNNGHVDSRFVASAHRMITTNGHIFSLHKTSTIKGLIRRVVNRLPTEIVGERVADIQWRLPKTYPFHKMAGKLVAVSLIHWTKTAPS